MRLIRILCSEPDQCFLQLFSGLVHQAAGDGICVAAFFPPTIHERDFLNLAYRQPHWDMAFLFLNNIRYESDQRTPATLARDAGNLIQTMKRLFGKPVICFYGWPDNPEFVETVIRSGADCLFWVPAKSEETVPALKYYLDRIR